VKDVDLVEAAGFDEIVDANGGDAAAAGVLGADEAADEFAVEIVEAEILATEVEVGEERLDHETAGVGDFVCEPHRVERPVSTELDHGAARANVFQHFGEDALLLRLVDAVGRGEETGAAPAVVAVFRDEEAVVHNLGVSADVAGVGHAGKKGGVGGREDVGDAGVPSRGFAGMFGAEEGAVAEVIERAFGTKKRAAQPLERRRSWKGHAGAGRQQEASRGKGGAARNSAGSDERGSVADVRRGAPRLPGCYGARRGWRTFQTFSATIFWPSAVGWMRSGWLRRSTPPTFSRRKGMSAASCCFATDGKISAYSRE